MEDGLVLATISVGRDGDIRLNPYCNGRWSRTFKEDNGKEGKSRVLILIVMEDGLVLPLC